MSEKTKLATKADLKEMYDRILPYLGGSADAGFTPVGTVISVMGKTAPVNYLVCDGTVYNIADYPELANYFLQQFEAKNYFGGDGTTTFAVPDLRGEFLRGTGTNSHTDQGSGGEVGEHQDGTAIPNLYYDANGGNFALLNEKPDSISGTSTTPRYIDSTITGNSNLHYVSKSGDAIVASSSSHFFTRPTNTSVLYCIATKNIYLNPSNDYSTDEKVVGTWIDGKTIYQKTIIGTTPTSTDVQITPLNVSIDRFVDAKCVYYNSNGTHYIGSFVGITTFDKGIRFSFESNDNPSQQEKNSLKIYVTQDSWMGLSFIVTLQYTKTT